MLRADELGAITVKLADGRVSWQAERHLRQRYWHDMPRVGVVDGTPEF